MCPRAARGVRGRVDARAACRADGLLLLEYWGGCLLLRLLLRLLLLLLSGVCVDYAHERVEVVCYFRWCGCCVVLGWSIALDWCHMVENRISLSKIYGAFSSKRIAGSLIRRSDLLLLANSETPEQVGSKPTESSVAQERQTLAVQTAPVEDAETAAHRAVCASRSQLAAVAED